MPTRRIVRGVLTLVSALCSPAVHTVSAQGAPPPRPATFASGEIRGRMADGVAGRPIASGSVTVRRLADSAFAGGALPRADGSFHVDGLPNGSYTVRVRALGFAPVVRPALIDAQHPLIDLGTITLSTAATALKGQEVVAEREDVALAPDRNSYSAKNLTTASGGTAIDVLRHVPSVEVDGTNNVSLRGNANVVVQINGRSSPLKGEQLGTFLAQLPAGAVRNVEVATNPSAKNDPEGTAGIINIVLNQEAELGLSGGLNASTGTTGQAAFGGNVGRQSGPLTLVLSGNFFRDNLAITGSSERTNLAFPVPRFVESSNSGSFGPRSSGLTLRSEYRLRKDDAVSFDAVASGGRFHGGATALYTDRDDAGAVIGSFDQLTRRASRNATQDYTLAFRRTGGPRVTTFSTELRYANNANDNDSQIIGVVHQADASTTDATRRNERDLSNAHFPAWSLSGDHTLPFGTSSKLESGFKGTDRHTATDFSAAYLDSANGVFVPADGRTTSFDYRERIGAVYGVLSHQARKVQAQAGLRLEEATTALDLPLTRGRVDRRYGSLFPSAIVSYNFTEVRQAKLSYSRRISRPDPQQLSPVEFRENSRTVFRGNPDLGPEYVNAVELGLQEARGWGSVQVNPYLRRSTSAVRFISQIDTSGVTVNTFANVASTTTTGVDLNVTYRHDALTLFTGGGASRYRSDASNLAGNLSARATVWSVRGNATYKLTPLTDAQMFANYRGPQATEGGRREAFVFSSVGLRHKLWGEQGSISLRVTDPFNLMKFGSRIENAQAIELTERHFGQRGVFISVSRNFGQQLKLRPRQDEPQQQMGAPVPGTP